MAAEFEIRNTNNGKFFWRFKAHNGEIVACSEVYESKQACEIGVNSIMSSAVFAQVRDLTL
jgi:uncharacterized protein